MRINRKWLWTLGVAAGVILFISVLTYFLNSESMRRYAENTMNQQLKDYTVRIGSAHFNPIVFSLLLKNIVLTQNANPNPPVANIQSMGASLHWSELLRLRVVAEFHIDRPKVFMNLAHFRNEERSPVPLKEKGWQEAVQSIYPIRINHLRISDGDFTYVDQGYKPLHASNVDLAASNIRNIDSPENVLPSTVHMKGAIFDKGTLTLDGRADFLTKPHMSFKGMVDLNGMDLSYFEPILARSNLSVRNGTLSTRGTLEYTPKLTAINVDEVKVSDLDAEYIHLPQTAVKEKQRVRETASSAGQYSNNPSTQVRIEELKVNDSTFAYVDRTANPNTRVFFSDVSGRLSGFTNQLREGPSKLDLRGKFMGSGTASVRGTVVPRTNEVNLALRIAIENTQVQTMKNIFRWAANVDVESGLFSLYSDLRIQNEQIKGWVKPIFKDLKIGEREDKKGSLAHKAYVGTVKALAKVLENRSKNQVATETDISGSIDEPDANIMQTVARLVSNAWIRAILPGFRAEAGKD